MPLIGIRSRQIWLDVVSEVNATHDPGQHLANIAD